MPKVAVILSGCGYLDGAEIHESVIALLALDNAGAQVQCFAPDVQQENVINHLDGQISTYRERNVLEESARIARGDIVPLADFKAADFDALILPGGLGVIRNLCNFAFEGPICAVDGEVERVIDDMFQAGKPIGAACIAPVLVARVLSEKGTHITLTIGHDKKTAQSIRDCGGEHVDCRPDEIVIDEKNKIVSTPAYMYESTTIGKVSRGITQMVDAVLKMI